MPFTRIQQRLQDIGNLPDETVSVSETLLLLGALERGSSDLGFYEAHLQALHTALEDEIAQNPMARDDTVLNYRIARLKAVILDSYHYGADNDNDDPEKVNFLTFIDRRKGIPVAIGALYLELAAKQGWGIYGLNFPGHFLLRMQEGSERCIIDPINHGNCLDAAALRKLLKSISGPRAELQHNYYDTITHRDIILRFCNNRKSRLITQGNYEKALETVRHELWIAPTESRLYFDAGVLQTKLDHIKDAISSLLQFIKLSDDRQTISEARGMISLLQGSHH